MVRWIIQAPRCIFGTGTYSAGVGSCRYGRGVVRRISGNDHGPVKVVNANPGFIFDQIDGWLAGLLRLLPDIAVALVVLVIFRFIAKGVAALVRRAANTGDRGCLGEVGGSLLRWIVVIIGVMPADTIVVPAIPPGEVPRP